MALALAAGRAARRARVRCRARGAPGGEPDRRSPAGTGSRWPNWRGLNHLVDPNHLLVGARLHIPVPGPPTGSARVRRELAAVLARRFPYIERGAAPRRPACSHRAAREFGVPSALAHGPDLHRVPLAPGRVSRSGAVGVGQLLPATADVAGHDHARAPPGPDAPGWTTSASAPGCCGSCSTRPAARSGRSPPTTRASERCCRDGSRTGGARYARIVIGAPSLVHLVPRRHRRRPPEQVTAVTERLARRSPHPRVHSRPAPTTPQLREAAMADDEEARSRSQETSHDDEEDEEPEDLVAEPLEEDSRRGRRSSIPTWTRTPRSTSSRRRGREEDAEEDEEPPRRAAVGRGGRGRRRPRRPRRRRGRSRHHPQGPPRRGRGHPGRGRGGGRARGAGEAGDRLQPKRADEQLCPSCFLLVRRTAPSCPMGDEDCPLFG